MPKHQVGDPVKLVSIPGWPFSGLSGEVSRLADEEDDFFVEKYGDGVWVQLDGDPFDRWFSFESLTTPAADDRTA